MSVKRNIERKLKPGWKLAPVSGTLYAVIRPSGRALRDDQGTEIRVNSHTWEGSQAHKELVSMLQSHGAIPKPQPTQRRQAEMRHEPRQATGSKNPIIMAREILADSRSTPRERNMARAYIRLLENHEAVRALAKALGDRLRGFDS